jgi:transcriptional regulator with XRE-family HTH domain
MSMYRYGKTVGEFTKRFRDEHSMTQADLAIKLKCDPQYVSNIERGVHRGAITFVKSLSKIIKDKNAARHLLNLVVDEKIEQLTEVME